MLRISPHSCHDVRISDFSNDSPNLSFTAKITHRPVQYDWSRVSPCCAAASSQLNYRHVSSELTRHRTALDGLSEQRERLEAKVLTLEAELRKHARTARAGAGAHTAAVSGAQPVDDGMQCRAHTHSYGDAASDAVLCGGGD
eukprot:6189116-Pleurochrysis_carterae.AAC.1